MQLETTSLFKILPREKLEVNPFHVPEMPSPPLPETSALGKLELKKKRVGGGMGSQRNILNLKWKTMRSLSVWIYVCLSVCPLGFFKIILLKL